MPTKQTGIIFLQRSGFQLYSPYVSSLLEFRFVPEIVRDLDIINEDLLENLIKLFITNNKIPPSNLMIIVADNAAFIKDFTSPATPANQPPQPLPANGGEALQEEAEKFIEHVPFENVVSKTFPWNNGLRAFAANKDLYEAIKNSFEKNGFMVEFVLPGFLLGNEFSTGQGFTLQIAAMMPEKVSGLRQNDLLTNKATIHHISHDQEEIEPEPDPEPESSKKIEMGMPKGSDRKRLFVMIGVFAVLIVVLVIVYIQSLAPQPEAKSSSPPIAVQPATTVNTAVETSLPSPTTVINSKPIEALTVTITTNPASIKSGQLLQPQLGTLGFDSITTENQPTGGVSQTVITFSGSPDPATRAKVLEEVRKISGEVTVQENKNSPVDILIVLAK